VKVTPITWDVAHQKLISSVAVLLWNGTLDQGKLDGDARLGRGVTVRVEGLTAPAYRLRQHRVDERHGNVRAAWRALGSPNWPDADGWAALRAADRLDEAEPPRTLHPAAAASRSSSTCPCRAPACCASASWS
jgi:xylan 1,4-beta-xylosidase